MCLFVEWDIKKPSLSHVKVLFVSVRSIMSKQTCCFPDEDRLLNQGSDDIISWFTNDCTKIIYNITRLKIILHTYTVMRSVSVW